MTNAAVKPGDVLAGKYRVERILGAGGMGYVVAARHLQLDQLVAMKFLRKGAVENAEAGARFLREAKAVVKLRNEHIAKVFDVGTLESGEPYIVMEHLDGCDLSALAKQRHVIPPQEAAEYVMQACEALAEAHSIGIIHRDIKLANLFITRGPAGGPLVKVLDFGISKMNPFGESEHDMTRTASMLGSPRFMSPEQMRDPRAVDGRSDIWSLGVVLYRLVGGRPPFEADTLGRLLTMVMHEQQAPLGTFLKDLPPGFDEVVARCLMKDPQMRFLNVAELAYALVPFSMDPGHARAAADRIAAVLASPQLPPITGDGSMPVMGPGGSNRNHTGPNPQMPSAHGVMPGQHRPSVPPGASDTGTAAPWAGTGNRPKPDSSRATTIWLSIALAGLIASAGIFAMLRQERQQRLQEQSQATAPPTIPVSPPPTAAPPPTVTADPNAPAAVPNNIIGASSPGAAPPPPTNTVAASQPTTTKRAGPVSGGGGIKRTTQPTAPTTKSSSGGGGSKEDGIPTTRD